jgi:phenylacetate-CoA ligase
VRLLDQLRGSAQIALMLRGDRRVPYLPREELDAARDANVRAIVTHTAASVPFYRDWFARERVDPREIRTADDLERLPLLDKSQVREEPHLFLATGRAARGAVRVTTSGSTGTPTEIHHDRRSLLANIPYGERERRPIIDGTGGSFRPRELYVGNETSVIKTVTAFYEANTLFVRPRRRFVSVREPVERVAALIDEERPDLLTGYGGWIHLFFKTVAARGIELRHPPKMVMYMAEALPPGGLELIEGDFGIPVMSRYSAAEAFKIGFYCEHRSGFHLHEDLCHVRATEGNRLVISNLVNRATVLLNYPIGDVGTIAGEGCECGRTFRLLSELEGRDEDMLPLADGRVVHPRAIWQVFMNDPDVLQYQLVQHEPRRFALELATVDEDAYARARDRALPELEQLLRPDPVVDVRRRPELERRAGGKFRPVASLCGPSAPTEQGTAAGR